MDYSTPKSSKKPVVSIVMPAYNSSATIEDSIESVLHQTFTDWELLIIDDCSEENIEKKVRGFQDKRIHYYRLAENHGDERVDHAVHDRIDHGGDGTAHNNTDSHVDHVAACNELLESFKHGFSPVGNEGVDVADDALSSPSTHYPMAFQTPPAKS